MKAINKFFYALLAFATVGMVACSEDLTHEAGPAELEGCYDVYFPDASVLETQGPMGEVSLDPSEATVFTYSAYRNNVDGEITVPVEISKNTTDKDGNAMFTVDPIVFADGEDVAEFTVTLSDKAEVGVPYTLTLSIANDPLYVKQYDTNNATTFSVTINRVKWIDVGMCSYTDDIVTGWYSFTFGGQWAGQTHPKYEVLVQVRADSINEAAFNAALEGTGEDAGLAGVYRMVNPYRVGPWGDPEDPSLTAVPNYILIHAESIDKVYIPYQPLGMDHIIADMSVMSEAYYQMNYASEPQEVDGMWGVIKDGTLRFEPKMLCGCPGGSYVGKIYNTNIDGEFALVIASALGVYELAMPDAEEDGDFSFTEVELPEGAMFYSESQAASFVPVLEKGRCQVSTKDADRIFYKEYGLLYRLPDLYEEGYPIYFSALEDGTVTLPKQYLNQATGLVQNGYEVKMAIDAEASKFDPATGLLTLVAEFYSGTGVDAVSYGVFEEVIAVEAPEFPVQPMLDLKNDFSYSPFYTAPLTSEFMDSEFDVTLEKGTCINPALTLDGTAYRLPSLYTNGYDIYFVADSEGNVGTAAGYELQPTGVNIYGKPAYMQILSGTCNEKTTILNAKFCDVEGNTLVPALCTETIVNYIWVEVSAGSYYSVLFGDNETQQIIPFDGRKLENAEGTDLYRIVNWVDFGADLTFTWDKTTNKCEIVGMVDTGIPSSMFGATGRTCVCDARTCLAWFDVVADWATIERNGYTQPYFDPATLTFEFEIFYVFPDMGVGYMLNDMDGLPVPFVEAYVLDAAPQVSTWENVAVGTFTHTTDFYASAEYLPYAQQNLALQRYGVTNKYKIVGIGDAQSGATYNIEFTYDEATGAVVVPSQKTGLQYKESDGSMTDIYCGDYWAIMDDWGIAANKGYTQEMVYGAYPNSYDAATKTFSFYLGYYDQLGYFYTTVADGEPQVHTFQITGDAPAATASVATQASVEAKAVKTFNRIKKHEVAPRKMKSMQVSAVKLDKLAQSVSTSHSLKTATPVKRQMKFVAF